MENYRVNQRDPVTLVVTYLAHEMSELAVIRGAILAELVHVIENCTLVERIDEASYLEDERVSARFALHGIVRAFFH